MITKKRLTKLINDSFRRSVISSMPSAKLAKYKIPQFARYTVDSCILHRDKEHENDKAYGYGYTPIQCLAAVMKDGTIAKRFFEFNSVNHFLKDKDGDRACEVVEAILVEWAKEDKNIEDFDMDKIDAEFAKIELEYVENEKRKELERETGRKIKDVVEPIVNKASGRAYDDVVGSIYAEVDAAVGKMKESGELFSYTLSLSRNDDASKARKEFHLDVGYRLTEKSEMLVLVCDVHAPRAVEAAAVETEASAGDGK